MLNFITIHGRLARDVELRQTQNGVAVCSFSVAVDRNYQQNGERQADFFEVVAWRGLAEMIAKYFGKGKEIVVYGEMQSRKWQDKEGNNRISWEIMANGVDFCGTKSDGNSNGVGNTVGNASNEPNKVDLSDYEEVNTDDLPF